MFDMNPKSSGPPTTARATLSNWPKILALFGLIGVAFGLTLDVTRNGIFSVLIAAVVGICLSIGYWLGADHDSDKAFKTRLVEEKEGTQTGAQSANSDPNNPAAITAPGSRHDREAVRFARAAIEAAPNPVLIIDATGRLAGTNQPARDRFSIDASQTRFTAIIRRPNLVDAVDEVFASGVARSLALESRVPVDRYENVSFAPFEADGERFVLMSIQDETEARMSERMRADFLANASHELRTPLAGIIGFIETLRGPAKDDSVARERFLEIMHLQADRMSRLISDLLSLSRIELNEHVAPTARSDFGAAIQEIVESLPPAKQKRIKFAATEEPLWIIGDWDEIQQIVTNLIDNALKYGGEDGDVRIALTGWQDREAALRSAMREWQGAARLPLTSPEVDHERLYCTLRVEDCGPGIARQHLPRLSERFYRIEETATGKSGTGLGLAIVKHIVNRHRGGLVVESEPGKGTAFSVYLPHPVELGPVRTLEAALPPSLA
jgi:two-component system phosphate regulon sensor histidine kinase PhoR